MSARERIPLSVPNLGEDEARKLLECLDTNFVSSVGPFVAEFERKFAEFVGAPYAVACASGTAAIHVALRLCGVEAGAEVLVSDLTFAASLNPVLYQGGTPVLVDSDEATWHLDPALVVAEIERRAAAGLRQPKVVEVVHILGHLADIAPIASACERYGIALVEDAAESLGARYVGGPYAGRFAGTVGLIGCYSFNGNKVMTTGGGGMLVTADEKLARRAKHLTTQARLPGLEYMHDEVGYNYRLTNLAAALGIAQLARLPVFLERKRQIARRYDQALASVPGIRLPPRPAFGLSSDWLYSVRVDEAEFGMDRTALHDRLESAGIETRPIWTPLHRMPPYASAARLGSGACADRLFAEGLSLPCSTGLPEEDQERVIDAIRAAHRDGGR